MTDDELIAKIMEGDANPDIEEHAEEMGERAVKGSPICRRVSLNLLRAMWDAGDMPTCEYITKVEIIASPGARNGDVDSLLCLTGAWALRSLELRRVGFLADAHRLEVQTIVMLGRLVNGGCDRALPNFEELRDNMPAAAVEEALAELWMDGIEIEPRPEPETMRAQDSQDARWEAAARFWGWSEDDDTPPTLQ